MEAFQGLKAAGLRTQVWFLAGALSVFLFLPSSESLWTDEAYTAEYARLADLDAFVGKLLADANSQAQLPLYLLQSWAFDKIIGSSEWALRAPNILWAACGIVSIYWLGKRLSAPWLPLFLAAHPYFWFYMDEARPYATQIGASCMALTALYFLVIENRTGRRWWIWMGFSLWILCGASMLGAVTTGVIYLTMIIWGWRGTKKFQSHEWTIMGVTTGGLILLGAYYFWSTFIKGAAGAALWGAGWKNIGFSLFEFSGSTGFSPPRAVLRDMAFDGKYNAILEETLAPILVLGGALFVLFLKWVVRWMRDKKFDFTFLCFWVFAASLGSLSLLAWAVSWSFWGRHLAPCFPFFIVWAGLACRLLIVEHRRTGVCFTVALIGLWLGSSLLIRFSDTHHRDDYRSASGMARQYLQQGKNVWWVADRASAWYYHLPDSRTDPQGLGARFFFRPQASDLQPLEPPDYIFLTKPDDLDMRGGTREYIQHHNYVEFHKLPAFVIYHKRRN